MYNFKRTMRKVEKAIKKFIRELTLDQAILIALAIIFTGISAKNIIGAIPPKVVPAPVVPSTTQSISSASSTSNQTQKKRTDSILADDNITVDDINFIITINTGYEENKGSIFKDKGQLFYNIASDYNINSMLLLVVTAYNVGWDCIPSDISVENEDSTPTESFKIIIKGIAEDIASYHNDLECNNIDDLVFNGYANEAWGDAIKSSLDNFYVQINGGGNAL